MHKLEPNNCNKVTKESIEEVTNAKDPDHRVLLKLKQYWTGQGVQCQRLQNVHCKRFITHSKKLPRNQGKRQNLDPSILPYKFGLIFMRMKQKKIFFEEKNSKWPFFKIANS